jgi:hypothetical protein
MGVKDHAPQVCDSAAAEALDDVFVTSTVVVDVEHGFDEDSLVSLAGFDHEYDDDSSMAGSDQTGELESSLVFVILAVALADKEEVVQSPFPPLPPLPSMLLLSLP